MKFLTLSLYLLAKLTLTLIPAFAINHLFFKKPILGTELSQLYEILSYHLHFCMSRMSHFKIRLLVKITHSLLCVTHHCMKVTSISILSSFSRLSNNSKSILLSLEE